MTPDERFEDPVLDRPASTLMAAGLDGVRLAFARAELLRSGNLPSRACPRIPDIAELVARLAPPQASLLVRMKDYLSEHWPTHGIWLSEPPHPQRLHLESARAVRSKGDSE